jgi:DNA-binding CsgD family transcriptional regulator
MQTLPGILRLLESAYAPIADETAWLEGVLDAAKAAFDRKVATQAYTAKIDDKGDITFFTLIGDDTINERMLRMIEGARKTDPTLIRRQFLSGPVLSVRSALAFDREGHLTDMFDRGLPGRDAVSAQGLDASGLACAISWVNATDEPLTPAVRGTLERIAGHLASAYRLRHRRSEDAAAKVTSNGELVESNALEGSARAETSLRDAALAIDRARRLAGTSPDEALAHWRALDEGRWTLVERFSDGDRRILVARPNEPTRVGLHALDPWEEKVVSLAVLGHSSKLIAYELGVSEGKVSRLTASALAKLGLRSRAELVEIHGALVGAATPADR